MLPMKTILFYLLILLFSVTSCQKQFEVYDKILTQKQTIDASGFVKYIIKKGEHSTHQNSLSKVEYEELKFKVKFDSSAIYKSVHRGNQVDINKLYGFSDNGANHHKFSARFGWNWGKNGLSLFSYTYNYGERAHKLITIINIGQEYNCSIKISGTDYIFTVNEIVQTMPRYSKKQKSSGYKLLPYFGGQETAPHPITIWIKEMK